MRFALLLVCVASVRGVIRGPGPEEPSVQPRRRAGSVINSWDMSKAAREARAQVFKRWEAEYGEPILPPTPRDELRQKGNAQGEKLGEFFYCPSGAVLINSEKASPVVCPKDLCIDYGSSGATFYDCTGGKIESSFGKFMGGANSFGRMSGLSESQLALELKKYLYENALMSPHCSEKGTKMTKCGGTAGNRFLSLKNTNDAGWLKFNAALSPYISGEGGCGTYPGTSEATWEWQVTDYADTFVGIGGASMQLRFPTEAPCPTKEFEKTTMIKGGEGASTPDDFCKRMQRPGDKQWGQLWSFLSDANGDLLTDDLHTIGGADQSVMKFGRRIESPAGAALIRDKENFGKKLIEEFNVDPMWKLMLTVLHPGGCNALSSQISLISNAGLGLGKNLDALPSLLQLSAETESMDSQELHTKMAQMAQLQFFEMAKEDPWPDLMEKIRGQCEQALENRQSSVFTKFSLKEDKKTPNDGFMCTINIFTMFWASTFAGRGDKPYSEDSCFIANWERLVKNSNKIEKVDWMTGYLKKKDNGGLP